jgi:hypothetical protein
MVRSIVVPLDELLGGTVGMSQRVKGGFAVWPKSAAQATAESSQEKDPMEPATLNALACSTAPAVQTRSNGWKALFTTFFLIEEKAL